MILYTFNALSIEEMQLLAQNIAGKLHLGDIVTLSGEVGAGKTSFARALIQSLTRPDMEVASPTFTLMQSYDARLADGATATLWHLDLYRLKAEEELEELGLEELWPLLTLIEWPKIAEHRIPARRLDISFDFGDKRDTRKLTLSGDAIWSERLKDLL
ncbi:MAG TPA: tRNA (adenosine(37)-N6)-threonylcarbamoyltransferase complex ATPase subunit type 1 TsaE [Rickettsiales bacterium]|nr:tRNA (adenosine(37)-N6)-threonylcarbamoyltransferase complex ATPase subunit type 1 TsaE [Rickettsiales bacterium]